MKAKTLVINLTIFLFSLFLIISCNQKNEKSVEKKLTVVDSISLFSYKLKNEPKLFLSYWDNMSSADYDRVSEYLLQNKIIRKITHEPFIEVASNYFYFETPSLFDPIIIPTFIDDKLCRVELFFQAKQSFNSLYKSYSEKYNLPILDSVCALVNCYKENNPKYKNNKTDLEKRVDEFNEAPVDTSNFLTSKTQITKVEYEKDYYYKIIPKNLNVNKNNNLILFEQTKVTKLLSYRNSELIGGSEFKEYIYSLDSTGLRQLGENSPNQLNSKTRTVLEYYIFHYRITYISEKKQRDFQKKNADEIRKYNEKKNIERESIEKVEKRNYDDI